MEVDGTGGRVWGMEIDVELARQELRELSGKVGRVAVVLMLVVWG